MSHPFFLGARCYPPDGVPLVMGILNATPDSFYDGGRYVDPTAALNQGLALVAQGADIIDVGGESTRPGAAEVPADEERDRVVPVIRALRQRVDVPISIDTTKPLVAEAALVAGATVVNDVSGLRFGDDLARLAARFGASLILMHSRARPATMQSHTAYDDLVGEVAGTLSAAAAQAESAGVPASRLLLDPGIGFAKTAEANLLLLKRLRSLVELGYPVLVGPSRKSFIGAVTGQPSEERLMGTIAASVAAVLGGARVLRLHDVAEAIPALRVAHAISMGRIP